MTIFKAASVFSAISDTRHKASDNQTRFVKAELAGVGTYMIPMGHLVEGPFDAALFRQSAAALVARHDALRTHFALQDGDVWALVSEAAHFQCHVTTLSDPALATFRDWAIPLVFNTVDPAEPGSLIRFCAADLGDRWRFTIAGHHAITDGISRGVMNKELLKLYAGEDLPPARSYYAFTNPPEDTPPPDVTCTSIVEAMPKPVRLVGDAIGKGDHKDTGAYVEHDFGPIQKQVTQVAKSLGLSKFGFLSAIYALGLRGFSGNDAVSSFFQSAGRQSLDAPASVVGSFSNTLPIDLTVPTDVPFAAFAGTVLGRVHASVAHENGPLLDRTIETGKAPSVSINMFPREAPIRAGSLVIGPREFLDRRTEFDLNLVWSEDRKSLKGRAFYNARRVSVERATLFLAFQERLLVSALADPTATCRDIIQSARAGHESVLPITSDIPTPKGRMHDAFFDTATTSPETVALTMTSGDVTYGALAAQALDYAAGLQAAGAPSEGRVAIYAQRGPEMIAAMLGASAYGISFGLVDASYPETRVRLMIDRLNTPYVIAAGSALPTELAADLTQVDPVSDTTFAPTAGSARTEAYVLFTSGTTGQPKLISHPDTALMRFINWQSETLALGQPIVTTMMAGLAHDPTLRDVFLPLSHSGCIAVPTPDEMREPCNLRVLVRKSGCNVLRLSPSSGRLLSTGMSDDEQLSGLRAIFWGGERLPRKTVDQWRALSPSVRQFNVFGATETPQAFLVHEVVDDGSRRDIPIGKALPWTGARLMDEDGRPVSRGEIGELVADMSDVIGGTHHPHADIAPLEPKTHYTGDIAYQMHDGAIRYAGRRDNQIKINGFRIELGEIEATVEGIVGAQRACALFAEERLQLFVLSSDDDITERALRAIIAAALPSYMMPQQISVLDSLPFTPNGKIDHDALLAMSQDTDDTSDEVSADALPATPLEQQIANIFAEFSRQKTVRRDQSLSDLGADSLATIETRLALEKTIPNLPDGWDWMEVSELAARVTATGSETPARTPRTDMSILLRCLAITSIVCFHSGFEITGGASVVLFVLAGFSFAQFQLPGILHDGHAGRVWALLGRLLVPLVPISLLYVAFNMYVGAETHISSVLLFRNLVDLGNALIFDSYEKVMNLIWLWFLHAYLQIFLIFGMLLSRQNLREALAANVWRGLAVFFVAAEVVNVAIAMIIAADQSSVAQAAQLLHTTPFAIIPFIVAGAVVATAKTPVEIGISFGIVLIHALVVRGLFPNHGEFWWILALVLCTAVPYVRIPQILAKPIVMIAAYSLMIYLVHSLVLDSIKYVAGTSDAVRFMSIFAQLIIGVAVGVAMKPIIAWFGFSGGRRLPALERQLTAHHTKEKPNQFSA